MTMKKLVMRFVFRNAVSKIVRIIFWGRLRWIPFLVKMNVIITFLCQARRYTPQSLPWIVGKNIYYEIFTGGECEGKFELVYF